MGAAFVKNSYPCLSIVGAVETHIGPVDAEAVAMAIARAFHFTPVSNITYNLARLNRPLNE